MPSLISFLFYMISLDGVGLIFSLYVLKIVITLYSMDIYVYIFIFFFATEFDWSRPCRSPWHSSSRFEESTPLLTSTLYYYYHYFYSMWLILLKFILLWNSTSRHLVSLHHVKLCFSFYDQKGENTNGNHRAFIFWVYAMPQPVFGLLCISSIYSR